MQLIQVTHVQFITEAAGSSEHRGARVAEHHTYERDQEERAYAKFLELVAKSNHEAGSEMVETEGEFYEEYFDQAIDQPWDGMIIWDYISIGYNSLNEGEGENSNAN